jgi:indoleacetamide hydrolase
MSATDETPTPARLQVDLAGGADDVLTGVLTTATAIRERRLSSAEATAQCLGRIESSEAAALNAFITIDGEAAESEARRLDAELARSGPIGPLHGVPIAVKDNLATRGLRTTGGTKLFEDRVPSRDADVVALLRAAGAVVIGKTNLHEAAFGITSKNPFYGEVGNPYDLARIPGGSSGGSAAAVAAGLCPGALGTDTGGSVRVPAAVCGLVGLKPSIHRVPTGGLMSLCHTTDAIGPLARTVGDAALIDAVLAGAAPDPHEAPVRSLRGIRFGVLGGYFSDVDDDTAQLMGGFVSRLEAQGAVMQDAELSVAEEALPALFDLVLPETWTQMSELLDTVEPGARLAARLDGFSPAVRGVLESQGGPATAPTPATSYLEALWHTRPRQQRALAQLFAEFDVLVSAATPAPAVTKDEDPEMTLNGRRVPTFETFIRHCLPASLAGTPALSLPIGFTAAGLPVGAQLMGPHMGDRGLLRTAQACEMALAAN